MLHISSKPVFFCLQPSQTHNPRMAKLSGGWVPLIHWPPAVLLGMLNGELKVSLGTEPASSKRVNTHGFASLLPEQLTTLWESASFQRVPWGMSQVCDPYTSQDRTARDPNSKVSKKTTFATNPISLMGQRHCSLQEWKNLRFFWKVAFKNKNLQNCNTGVFFVWFYIEITCFIATASFEIPKETVFYDEIGASGYNKQYKPKSR